MEETSISKKKTMHTSVKGRDVTLVFAEERRPQTADLVKEVLLEAWIKKTNAQH